MVTPESLQPGAEKKMTGSVIIYEAESIEDVKALVYGTQPFTLSARRPCVDVAAS